MNSSTTIAAHLRISSQILLNIIVVATFAALAAYSQQAADPFDLVHMGDTVEVDVEGGYDYDWHGKVNDEGFLDGLNEYGDPIPGLCRSTADIAADVTAAYSKTLRDPKINVRIIDRSGRAAAVLDGAVRSPQRFLIKRHVKLSELIARSGGITDEAGGVIDIFRPQRASCAAVLEERSLQASAGPRYSIKISDILAGNENSDPEVVSGDIVTVEKAEPVYVIGGVGNPRPIALTEKLTISHLIAKAGGLAKDADGSEITLFRRKDGRSDAIRVDLAKVTDGTDPDIEVLPYDIVDVPQKGRDKRKDVPVIAPEPPRSAPPPLSVIE